MTAGDQRRVEVLVARLLADDVLVAQRERDLLHRVVGGGRTGPPRPAPRRSATPASRPARRRRSARRRAAAARARARRAGARAADGGRARAHGHSADSVPRTSASCRSRSSTVPEFATTKVARARLLVLRELARGALVERRRGRGRRRAGRARPRRRRRRSSRRRAPSMPGLEQQRRLDHRGGRRRVRGSARPRGRRRRARRRSGHSRPSSQARSAGSANACRGDGGAVDHAAGRHVRAPAGDDRVADLVGSRRARARPRRSRASPRRGARARRAPWTCPRRARRSARRRGRRSPAVTSGGPGHAAATRAARPGRAARRRRRPPRPRPRRAPRPRARRASAAASAAGLLGGGRLRLGSGGLGVLRGGRLGSAAAASASGSSAAAPRLGGGGLGLRRLGLRLGRDRVRPAAAPGARGASEAGLKTSSLRPSSGTSSRSPAPSGRGLQLAARGAAAPGPRRA